MEKEQTEELKQKINEQLTELANKKILVIVEGQKDETSLQKLGITNIIQLSKKPLYDVVERITTETAILTDLDYKGKQLYNKINTQLQQRGIKVNNKLRQLLFKAKISHIEGLATYMG